MRIYSSESFWSIAQLWYTCFGFIILAMLGNAIQHGFGELLDIVSRMSSVAESLLCFFCSEQPASCDLATSEIPYGIFLQLNDPT